MRQLTALALVGTVALTATASSLPRGVGPEFAQFFESKDSFTCIGHPTISLKPSQVNDGSCDCPDGSDEPGTAACAHINSLSPPQPLAGSTSGTTNTTNPLPGFWCANVGHVGMYVPFMYVNDGVCDYDLCCDGTEEYAGVGGVKCESRCDEIGKEYRRKEKEKKDGFDRAMKRRKTLAKESKELRRRLEAKIESLKGEIQGLENKRDELKRKYEEVERAERGKTVKTGATSGKLGILLSQARSRVESLRDALEKVVSQRDALQARVDELETILSKFKEEYNPNFNDEGVKAAVHGWEDYAAKLSTEDSVDIQEDEILDALKEDSEESGINWRSFEEPEATDTDILYSIETYLPAFLRDMVHSKITSLRVWLIENGILADTPTASGESALVTAAREAYEEVDREISNKQRDLDNEIQDLETDYGPGGIFRALKGKCVSTDSGEYTYELCWMESTTQKSKKGHGNTNMGKFTKTEIQESEEDERADGKGLGTGPRMVLKYENGQGCWNGPNRRTDVWLGCSETEELWRVSESEKCVYKMEVGTPVACEQVSEGPVHEKDEL